MKPINAAERRSQFVKFALLFLLAMVPVAIFISSFNRIERQAYETLRKERNELRIASTHNKEHDDLVAAIYSNGNSVRRRLNELEADLMQFQQKKDGPLVNDLEAFQKSITRLKLEGGDSRGDAALIEFAQDMEATVSKMREVYEAGFKEVMKQRDQLEKAKEEKLGLLEDIARKDKEIENCRISRGY